MVYKLGPVTVVTDDENVTVLAGDRGTVKVGNFRSRGVPPGFSRRVRQSLKGLDVTVRDDTGGVSVTVGSSDEP